MEVLGVVPFQPIIFFELVKGFRDTQMNETKFVGFLTS